MRTVLVVLLALCCVATVLSFTGPACIKNCNGKSNGDYQSCQGCNVYATCSNGIFYDNRPCAATTVWDDKRKRCEYTSATCWSTYTGSSCIWNCKGKSNGDYQSCRGCNVYATCSNGIIYDNRPCAATTVWDDNLKRCEYKSSTCKVPKMI